METSWIFAIFHKGSLLHFLLSHLEPLLVLCYTSSN